MMDQESGFKRIAFVSKVLASEGFWYLIDELDLRRHLSLFGRWFRPLRSVKDARPRRIRNLLEHLGGFYIKLGQLLSLRPDLVPIEYCEEFATLQDNLQAEPFSVIKKMIEQEIGGSINKVFSQFLSVPIGSASIAQVHGARLRNGQSVVVKVMRPRIKEKFMADIEVMYFFAHRLEKHVKGVSPVQIVKEFEQYTMQELNFLEEGSHIQKFYQNFAGSKTVKIPVYYKEYSTKNILVMEYIHGIKLSQIINGVFNHYNKVAIAKNLFDLCIRQVFLMDIFHADMHPGNILVLKDDRVGLVDFGITGALPPKIREKGIRLYVALVDKDVDAVFDSVISMAYIKDHSDPLAFKKELGDIIDVWHGEPLSKSRITHVLHQILLNCNDYGIQLPPSFLTLGKALVTIEGTCLKLYPEFNFVEESKPYLVDLLQKQFRSDISLRSILKHSLSLKSYLEQIPRKALAVLDTIEQAKVSVTVEAAEVGYLGRTVAVSSERIAIALVIAACTISGALILQVNLPPYYRGYSLVALVVFGIAIAMSIVLIISFFREKKFYST
ncbi:MAG: AarF/UbiB family protein [Nanoarchaeota archaeon]